MSEVEEYTPTTEQVREAWHDEMFPNASDEAFDRWLAAHDLQVAERALEPIRVAEAEWRRTPRERADVRFRSRVLAALRASTEGSGQ